MCRTKATTSGLDPDSSSMVPLRIMSRHDKCIVYPV
jgi:hypothetical protein